MKEIVIDFETHYSSEYTLRKMTQVEYILDPRYETIGAAVRIDGRTVFLDHHQLLTFFGRLKAQRDVKVAMISHNALFDACIMAWRYDYVPDRIVDTMAMCRAWYGHRMKSLALASVALDLGFPPKGGTVHKVQGMTAQDIREAGLWDEYAEYSNHDADLCWQIYQKILSEGFPEKELDVLDRVLRCAVQPRFELDVNVLAEHLHITRVGKQALLDRCGLANRDDLMSNERFAEALRRMNVEPPMKTSLKTGKLTYAFAKTDPAFVELQEHDDHEVQALVNARLGTKSTLEETRTERLLAISGLRWPSGAQSLMPVPLRYSGAHTHRLCLTGDTSIAVLRGNRVVYTRLDQVLVSDLVWDGEEFVRHGGAVYAGVKRVIEYDGVVGTPDHRVWTVECGYCALEVAKARGYNIARGAVPDPTRINEAVLGSDFVQDPGAVFMCEVRNAHGLHVERPSGSAQDLVQEVQHVGEDGGESTSTGNARRRQEGECGGRSEKADGSGGCSGASYRKALCEISGKNFVSEVVGAGLDGRYDDGHPGAPEVHQPQSLELPVLWGARNRVPVPLDPDNGGLALDEPRAEAARGVYRPNRLQRTLRTGQPSLGFQGDAGTEPVFRETWDIIGCGPRNRFCANGRIVHNSGDWKLNMQNLPRGGALRRALRARAGYKVVAADASQIEARLVACFCGQQDLVDAFANGEDVYSSFASKVFGYEVTKKTNPIERFIGKTAVLGLGYGLGWENFQRTVRMQSKAQVGKEVALSDEEAQRVVQTYRSGYPAIPAMWRRLTGLIPFMLREDCSERLGPVVFEHKRIRLPSGLFLRYHDLRQMLRKDGDGFEWTYTYAGMPKRLYGGALLENIIQALARICVMDADQRVFRRVPRLPLALQVHDELVYVVPERAADATLALVLEEMCRRPGWMPDVPLAAEGGVSDNYGGAK